MIAFEACRNEDASKSLMWESMSDSKERLALSTVKVVFTCTRDVQRLQPGAPQEGEGEAIGKLWCAHIGQTQVEHTQMPQVVEALQHCRLDGSLNRTPRNASPANENQYINPTGQSMSGQISP